MPVSITRLLELIELASSGGVEGLDLVEDGTEIRITRNGSVTVRPLAAVAPVPTKPASVVVEKDILVSPMFGVLHLTPSPEAKPYVVVGDPVRKGQQICLIEAMKMFNPVYSDRDGHLHSVLASAGSEVTPGQPLMRIIKS